MSSLSVGIAGIVFQIQLPTVKWTMSVQGQYAAFLTDAPATWQVELQYDPTLTAVEYGWVRNQGEVTTFRLLAYQGQIDFQRKRAQVAAPSIERAASALDRVLAYVLMHMLPRNQNALLIHGVGLAIQGQGHVFFGPSGAGKTTIATLASDWGDLFSDENVILSCVQPQPRLHSTPFWGYSTPGHLIRRTNRHAPLRALYALRHGPDFGLKQMSPAESVIALLLTEKVAADRVDSMTAWLAVAEVLLATMPVYTLTFRPTPELWPFLRSEGVLE